MMEIQIIMLILPNKPNLGIDYERTKKIDSV
jgi:hypothetical protein